MKTVNGILIDAKNKTIKMVEFSNLEDIYKLLGVTIVEVIRVCNYDTMYIDEEGAINGTKFGFNFGSTPIFGNALICHTDEDGEDMDPISTLEEIRGWVNWGQVPIPHR